MKKTIALLLLAVLTYSCATYTITPEKFKQQFTAADTISKAAKINNPLLPLSNITYKANNIKGITVVDKKGMNMYLENSPSLEMRITQKNGKRRVVYFDTVELRNDTLYGGGSRFVKSIVRKIPLTVL